MTGNVQKVQSSDEGASKPKYFRSPLKWPGGKFRDLGRLMPLFPKDIDRYIDPFVGSGTVAANVAIQKLASSMVLGDIDSDLIRFLQMRGEGPTFERFQSLLIGLESARHDAALAPVNEANFPAMFMVSCLRCLRHIDNSLRRNDVVKTIVEKERERRISAMAKMIDLGSKPEENYPRTAIFAVIYYLVRDAYNDGERNMADPAVRVATWFVLRELAHGGIMRYSRETKFNTAYGGMSYNTKSMLWKLPDIARIGKLLRENNAEIRRSDFMTLLDDAAPGANDFIFLDPPYEQAFHGNVAEGQDISVPPDQSFYPYVLSKEPMSSHSDLFRWLRQNGSRTRWMLVERQTPWIMDQINTLIESDARILVQTYDRKYAANIKGRNNRSTTHVIVTNYPTP